MKNVALAAPRAIFWSGWLLVCGLAWFPPMAQAQEQKPVAVLAVNSLDAILADVKAFASALGEADNPELGLVRTFLPGIDFSKPAGAILYGSEADAEGLAFIPVRDVTPLLNFITQRFGLEVEDVQPGIRRVRGVYFKEQDGYVFLSEKADALSRLPDPARMLGDLPKKFDLAVQFHVGNLSPELRKKFFDGVELAMAKQQIEREEEDEEEAASRKELEKMIAADLRTFMEEGDSFWMGVDLNAPARKLALEVGYSARSGTAMSARIADAQSPKTRFSALGTPASIYLIQTLLHVTDRASQDRTMVLVDQFLHALQKADENEVPPQTDAEKEWAKDFLGQMREYVESVVQAGKLDVGMDIAQDDGLLYAILAVHAPNGQRLEALTRQGLTYVKEHNDKGGEIKLDAARYNGAVIHSVGIADKRDDAATTRKLFGGQPEMLLAVTDDALFMVFGHDQLPRLQKLIDNSPLEATTPVKTMEFGLNLGPFLSVVQHLDPDQYGAECRKFLEEVQPGTDRIEFAGDYLENGFRYRLESGLGIVQALQIFGPKLSQQDPLNEPLPMDLE